MSCDIRQITSDEARDFWRRQDDARIFLHPDVLSALCERVDWWLATWNGNPVCLWPMCHAVDGTHRPPELSAYIGPLWDDTVTRAKAHRWWGITSAVQRAMLELFAGRYTCFEFELPPGTSDVRTFQWLRDESGGRFDVEIECRHTALLPRPTRAGTDDLLELFATNRRYDARRASKQGMQSWPHPDPEAIYRMYEDLLGGKMRADTARRRRAEVHALIALAEAGHGRLLAFADAAGQPATFSLSLHSRRSAHLALIVSSPSPRSQGLQAWSQLMAMSDCFSSGRVTFDFGGANSPLGAEEKHRYGGWPAMYFRIRVSAP